MGIVRSALVGIIAAIIASVAAVAASIVIPIGYAALQTWSSGGGGAIAGGSIGIPSWPMLLAALVGFGMGFTWDRRRAARKLAR